jgi:OOP family OmpA-OmpF porin
VNARLSLTATSAPGSASDEDPNSGSPALLELARCVDPNGREGPEPPAEDPRLEAMRGVLFEREQVALAAAA